MFDMCSVNFGELCALVNLMKIGLYLIMWDCAYESLYLCTRWSLMMMNWFSVVWIFESWLCRLFSSDYV